MYDRLKEAAKEDFWAKVIVAIMAVGIIIASVSMWYFSQKRDAELYVDLEAIIMLPNGETVQGDVTSCSYADGIAEITVDGVYYETAVENVAIYKKLG